MNFYIDNNINENSSGFGESGGDRGRGGSGRWGSLYGVPVRAAGSARSRRSSLLPSTRDRELGKHTSNYKNCVCNDGKVNNSSRSINVFSVFFFKEYVLEALVSFIWVHWFVVLAMSPTFDNNELCLYDVAMMPFTLNGYLDFTKYCSIILKYINIYILTPMRTVNKLYTIQIQPY